MKENKKSDFEKFIEKTQQEIIEEERAIYSKKVIEENNNPKNTAKARTAQLGL